MAVRTEPVARQETFEERLARLRVTPAQRARVLANARPFDSAAWLRETVPATQQEVAELDAFLSELDDLRQESLRRQAELLSDLGA